jgi:hypothetical protein
MARPAPPLHLSSLAYPLPDVVTAAHVAGEDPAAALARYAAPITTGVEVQALLRRCREGALLEFKPSKDSPFLPALVVHTRMWYGVTPAFKHQAAAAAAAAVSRGEAAAGGETSNTTTRAPTPAPGADGVARGVAPDIAQQASDAHRKLQQGSQGGASSSATGSGAQPAAAGHLAALSAAWLPDAGSSMYMPPRVHGTAEAPAADAALSDDCIVLGLVLLDGPGAHQVSPCQ